MTRTLLGEDTHWPRVAASMLPDWEVVEEGLPGRTAHFPDLVMGAHMDGRGLCRKLGFYLPMLGNSR
jgi:hypothetical protein